MNVTPILARWKSSMGNALGSITTADSVDDVRQQLAGGRPCGFLLFTGLGGGEAQGGSGVTKQKTTYRFMALLAARDAGFKLLSKTATLEALREQVIDTFFGWMGEGMATPAVLVSARVMLRDEEAKLLFLGIEFQTTYYIIKTEST